MRNCALGARIRARAVLKATTGPPFDITTGYDEDSDGVANDRPSGVTRNTGQGPGTVQLDLLLAKLFACLALANRDQRSRNLGFNVDDFNAFNHTNLNDFVGIETPPLFDRANSALPASTIQLSFRYHF